MSKKILIVESPNKIKKISSFLGNEWIVLATAGHIKELTDGLDNNTGVSFQEHRAEYQLIKTKSNFIKTIREATKKAEEIYLASDPDREGEAISLHVYELLSQKEKEKCKRITFTEITKKAIEEAILNPREIDKALCDAREARTILDKGIGFFGSSLARKKIGAKSVGRVSTATLILTNEREEENKNHKIIKSYKLYSENGSNKIYLAELSEGNSLMEKIFSDEREVNEVSKNLKGVELKFQKKIKKEVQISPPKAHEMATILSDAYSKHKISNESATMALQELYENGYITYPRTDSQNITDADFIEEARIYLREEFNLELVTRVVKAKKNDQEAHEALRPTHINNVLSESISSNGKKIYKMILKRSLLSLMPNGVDEKNMKIYTFENNYFIEEYSLIKVKGFRNSKSVQEDESEEGDSIFDSLIEEKNTKPKPLFNPSSLIKEMKSKGIGRPSTYSTITSSLEKNGYLTIEKGNKYSLTELGKRLVEFVKNNLANFLSVKMTSILEKKLDEISTGQSLEWDVIDSFWIEFKSTIDELQLSAPNEIDGSGINCNECGAEMLIRNGKVGKFLGCSNYPNCIKILDINGNEIVKKEKVKSEKSCPKCNSVLYIRDGKRGKFLGCSNYPNCKHIEGL